MGEMEHDRRKMRVLVGRLRRAYRRAAAALLAVRLSWLALALAGGLLALDAMFPLPGGARLALALAAPAALLGAAALTWWRATHVRSLEDHVVRRLERGHAGLENDLINALEFGRQLATAPPAEKITADLMQRAIGRAVSELAPIRDLSPLRPPNLPRERAILFFALGLAALALLAFHNVFFAVLPRYLDPFGDHPPYSPTHIEVIPAGTQVDYGSQLVIRAKTSGVPAREASLILEDEEGKEIQRLAMFETEAGQFAQTIENIRQPLRYYIGVPQGRSRRFVLGLNKTPRIESVVMKLTAPAYTHKPDQERLLSQPTIKSYAGGRVRLTFKSNRPLAGGELKQGDQAVKLVPDGDRAVSGELELKTAGKAVATVTDIEGLGSTVPWQGKVEILPDEKPTIAISSPGMDSFAIPEIKLPIVIEANDDLGFRYMALVRNVNGSKDFRKVLVKSDGSQSFIHAVEILDLADLGVRPGDVISYYATATDSNPDGPQTIASPAYQLSIISNQEYREFMQNQMTAKDLAEKYHEYLARLERLAKEQEALKKETDALAAKAAQGQPLSKAERDQLADAQRRQQDAARQTRELAEDMRQEAAKTPIFDIEKSFKQDLQKFAGQVSEAAGKMESAGSSMDEAGRAPDPARAGNKLRQSAADQQEAMKRLGQSSEDYKKGIETANKRLARAMNLIGDVEKFKELYQRQKELERQARLYKDQANPGLDERVRMKELAQEENAIGQQMEQLAGELTRHADEVAADEPKIAGDARRIAQEIGTRQISATARQAGDRFGEGDGHGGHPLAAEALKQMEAMISFCESMGGEGGQCDLRLKIQMGRGGMSMGETLAQLRAGMNAGQGRLGAMGRGSDGMYGSASTFGIFGSEKFGTPTKESRIAGSPTHAQGQASGDRLELSTVIEELSSARDEERKVKIRGGERVMEEYRALIEAYFRSLAEEKEGGGR